MLTLIGQFLVSCAATLSEWRDQLSDEELIEKVKKGGAQSKEAFEILVERHQLWLVRLLKNLVSGAQDAEDLAQNVLVKAYFALPKFRQDSSFKTWLRVIATREAFNHFRKRKADVDDEADVQAQAHTNSSHDDRLEAKEALSLALSKVPYAYREILILRYVEEMEMAQIEEALGIGSSAAKMRLKRAREFFKDIYQGETALDER